MTGDPSRSTVEPRNGGHLGDVGSCGAAVGGKSPAHHHAGSVLAYVLSGAIRSENSATGPAKVYQAGETFFEPPGSEHLVSENVSAIEPASLLAVFVADDSAQLTTFDH